VKGGKGERGAGAARGGYEEEEKEQRTGGARRAGYVERSLFFFDDLELAFESTTFNAIG
jgi:hypothetical protein